MFKKRVHLHADSHSRSGVSHGIALDMNGPSKKECEQTTTQNISQETCHFGSIAKDVHYVDIATAHEADVPGAKVTSFRRSIRDGDFHYTLDRESEESVKNHFGCSRPVPGGLSFTDEIISDECNGMKIKKGKMSKNGGKKGLRMTLDGASRQDKPESCTKDNEIAISQGPNCFESSIFIDTNSFTVDEEDKTFETNFTEYSEDLGSEKGRSNLNRALIPKLLEKKVQHLREECALLYNNILANKKLIDQNNEQLDRIELVKSELEKESSLYCKLLEQAKCLAGLRSSKFTELKKSLESLYNYRHEESDALYRMRRWFYCDLLQISGNEGIDYRCGYLEEIDPFGRESSNIVKNSAESRRSKIEELKNNYSMGCCDKATMLGKMLTGSPLGEYCTKKTRDCFFLDIPLSQLLSIYKYDIDKDPINFEIMDDVAVNFKSLRLALEPFRKFHADKPDDFLESNVQNNFKPLFLFYANYSLLFWDPLNRNRESKPVPFTELEWYKEVSTFSPEILPELLQEVMLPACMAAIESWDVESDEESELLSTLLIATMKGIASKAHGVMLEKLVTFLLKTVENRIDVVCIKGLNNLIMDAQVANAIKYRYLRVASNLMYFSGILVSTTLSKLVLDLLFLDRLLPMLNFHSPHDAFITLQFCSIIAPVLESHLAIKTKTNSFVKSTFRTFAERPWDPALAKCATFRALGAPMTQDNYDQLIRTSMQFVYL